MMVIWSDPAVQAAIIQSVGGVIAATIAAVCAAIIGKELADRKRLQEKFEIAQKDILFLLAVEAEHCNRQRTPKVTPESHKRRVRSVAADSTGIVWSGKFTAGRVKVNLITSRKDAPAAQG